MNDVLFGDIERLRSRQIFLEKENRSIDLRMKLGLMGRFEGLDRKLVNSSEIANMTRQIDTITKRM